MDRHHRHLIVARPLAAIACFSTLAFWGSESATAKAPQVRFDTALVVPCQDVPPEQFAAVNPDRIVVEARIEISAMLTSGNDSDLLRYVYRVVSPHGTLRVLDYEPRTTLTSDYSGGINIEKKQEKSKSAGLAVTGAFDHLVKATGSGDVGSKDTLIERYELTAPMESLAASGTIVRGHGVYYKLRATRQTTLEGSKEFVIRFEAPATWRGGVLQVRCEAFGVDRGVWKQLDEEARCGAQEFLIALHLGGDEEARYFAESFVRAGMHLSRISSNHQKTIKRRRFPSVFHEVGAALEIVEPRISETWLNRIIYASAPEASQINQHLPQEVRAAASQYLIAKQRLRDLRR